MQTIQIKIDEGNLDFFIELVKNLNFVAEVQITGASTKTKDVKTSQAIRLPEGKPSISDFEGFWFNNPKTLEQIREKGWKRI
ncbi:MAG: hypothetical protein P1P88_06435 [Bacteroidales bacterium]|nr:hypothetical protein [Bacteroidales bacterium]